MDQRGGGIGLALIGLCTAGVWWWAAAACRRRVHAPGTVPLLSLAATATVFLCVPETDHLKGVAVLLAGMALLEVAAGEVLPFGWHALGLTVVIWAGLWGATGRPGAVVGAVFAGWVFVLPAVIPLSTGPASTPGSGVRRLRAAFVIAAIAAVVVARTGALGSVLLPALYWAAAMASGSTLIALLVVRSGRPRRRPR